MLTLTLSESFSMLEKKWQIEKMAKQPIIGDIKTLYIFVSLNRLSNLSLMYITYITKDNNVQNEVVVAAPIAP